MKTRIPILIAAGLVLFIAAAATVAASRDDQGEGGRGREGKKSECAGPATAGY